MFEAQQDYDANKLMGDQNSRSRPLILSTLTILDRVPTQVVLAGKDIVTIKIPNQIQYHLGFKPLREHIIWRNHWNSITVKIVSLKVFQKIIK